MINRLYNHHTVKMKKMRDIIMSPLNNPVGNRWLI